MSQPYQSKLLHRVPTLGEELLIQEVKFSGSTFIRIEDKVSQEGVLLDPASLGELIATLREVKRLYGVQFPNPSQRGVGYRTSQ